MISNHRSLLVVVMVLLLMIPGNGQKDCCFCGDIEIRYPFQLIDCISNHTENPGFLLSCVHNSVTILELPPSDPHPAKLIVTHINYTLQLLFLQDPQGCLPKVLLKLHDSSIYPFQFYSDQLPEGPTNLSFFDCSSVGYIDTEYSLIQAKDPTTCPFVGVYPEFGIVEMNILFCTKMFDTYSTVLSSQDFQNSALTLRWSKPNSSAENFFCKNKSTKNPISTILEATGSIVLVLMLIAFFYIYRYFKMKGDDQARVKMFLKDYNAMRPTRFSYADLKRITNHFKDKLGEGAHGAVFKGKLSNEILVAVKILNSYNGDGQEFINEVGILGKIHHVNVVRLLGFCADGFHRALVYDFFPNGSLQNFISPPDNKDIFIGWEKIQEVAIGIAKGIEYLHQGCDHRILHFDINPHNVLLDHNFTPKISDFGIAKLCSKNRSTVSMTAARGTLGYIAPEVFSRNFGNVSYKSDIYSYGILMIEMVGGRNNTNKSEQSFQVLYPEWIHNLVEGRDIHIHIENEKGVQIAKKLAIVGLWCIQWHPMNRPSMKTVIQMLEGECEKLKVPPTPFDFTPSSSGTAVIPKKGLSLEMEVIHELE